MWVPGGRLPTQSAWPDCLGFLGGPRGTELLRLESELCLLRSKGAKEISTMSP